MSKIHITKENKKKYQQGFVEWMEKNYPNIQRPDIMASNVMYTINQNRGFSLNELVNHEITLDEYRDKFEQYFEKINRKSPRGHADVQRWGAQYFMEHISDIYLKDKR
ncbi:MAG: hypothetical protein JXR88_17970 [Clostridia bacterium]|nr:hypothetical protein [Clostridia bacterium]